MATRGHFGAGSNSRALTREGRSRIENCVPTAWDQFAEALPPPLPWGLLSSKRQKRKCARLDSVFKIWGRAQLSHGLPFQQLVVLLEESAGQPPCSEQHAVQKGQLGQGHIPARGAAKSNFLSPLPSPPQWLRTWISLDKAKQLRCWFFDVAISREDGHLWLNMGDLQPWHSGLFRCVGSNTTGNASISRELELRVECTWVGFR